MDEILADVKEAPRADGALPEAVPEEMDDMQSRLEKLKA